MFPGLERSVKECAGSMQEHVSVQSCNEEKMDQAAFVIPGLASGFGIAQIPYRARRPFLWHALYAIDRFGREDISDASD